MQEVGWEHHVVSLIPEFGVVLVVEVEDITGTDETETRADQESEPEPHEKGRVVEGALGDAHNHARQYGSECSQNVIDLYPVVVDNAECATKGVLRILALTHL